MSSQQGANYDVVLLITCCRIFKASISTEMDIAFMSLSTGFVVEHVTSSYNAKRSSQQDNDARAQLSIK